MTTVINNPKDSSSSALGFVVGILVVGLMAVLFFLYVWPQMRKSDTTKSNVDINLNLPTKDSNTSAQ